MVSQAANKFALQKYQQFTAALNTLLVALDEASSVIAQMRDSGKRSGGWKIPAKREVVSAHRQARSSLDVLRAAAKEYEAELVSRGWRV